MAFEGWISRRVAAALVAAIAAVAPLGAAGDAAAGILMIAPVGPPNAPHPYPFLYWDSVWDPGVEHNDVVVRHANVQAIPRELYRDPVPADRAEAFVLADTGARVVADSALTSSFQCVAAEHIGVCQPFPLPSTYTNMTGLTVSLGAGDDRANMRDGTRNDVICGTGTDTVVVDAVDRVSSDCENVTAG
jgi:hypothetical protein